MTLQARYDEAKRELESKGYKVSAGSWIEESESQFYVFSTQGLGPAYYGHSAASISYKYETYQKRFDRIRGNW